MAEPKHVFISYVWEDSEKVGQLCNYLETAGVQVWRDRNNIMPGVRWRQAVRKAIQNGAFFIACFSKEYNDRTKTYMNEELTLAIDELRQHSIDTQWFLPVKLNKCEIPDRDIGGGETLQDFQYFELYKNWNAGFGKILGVIQSDKNTRASRQTKIREQVTGEICAYINCPQYGKQQDAGVAVACSECGHPFGWVCRNCKELNPNQLRECGDCGFKRQLPTGFWA